MWDFGLFISFEIALTGRINLKKNLGYDIKYLSIWAFMRYPCFLTEKVSKVTFILFCQKNSHEINRGTLWCFGSYADMVNWELNLNESHFNKKNYFYHYYLTY